MKNLGYSTWHTTCDTLHMVMQMMGKIKLRKMSPQPEWKHSLLQITARGFSTGLIPDGDHSFEISIDILNGMVDIMSTNGVNATFELHDGVSVSGYYADLMGALGYVGHPVVINVTPQEFHSATPFTEQTRRVDFDHAAARNFFMQNVFARNALLDFAAPYRGKKICPSLFWGSFDMTTVLFSGVEKKFPGTGVIEESAFDEQFIEFGFWPGDPNEDDPTFFVMAYPFLKGELDMSGVSVENALYSPEKAECFLKLKDALATPDPQSTVVRFCQETFAAISKQEKWGNVKWFTKPLLSGETSQAIAREA